FDTPGLTVDTHMGRLARRFGWTEETDPVKAENDIAALFPKKELTVLSHRVIFHGRRICHSRRPACGACPLTALCPSFGIGELDPEKARSLLRFEMSPEATSQARSSAPRPTAGPHARPTDVGTARPRRPLVSPRRSPTAPCAPSWRPWRTRTGPRRGCGGCRRPPRPRPGTPPCSCSSVAGDRPAPRRGGPRTGD